MLFFSWILNHVIIKVFFYKEVRSYSKDLSFIIAFNVTKNIGYYTYRHLHICLNFDNVLYNFQTVNVYSYYLFLLINLYLGVVTSRIIGRRLLATNFRKTASSSIVEEGEKQDMAELLQHSTDTAKRYYQAATTSKKKLKIAKKARDSLSTSTF